VGNLSTGAERLSVGDPERLNDGDLSMEAERSNGCNIGKSVGMSAGEWAISKALADTASAKAKKETGMTTARFSDSDFMPIG
jgi:hypothetical protein